MSNKQCCVPGCLNSLDTNANLHKFPNPDKDKELFNKWVYSIGGDILQLGNDHIFKYRRVCQVHFEEKYHCRNNRLSKGAVPTRNMPGLSALKFNSNSGVLRPLRIPEAPTSTEPVTSPSDSVDMQAHTQRAVEEKQIKENLDPITSPRCATVSRHYVPIHATVAVENVQSNQNRDPITSPRCATVSRHYVPKHATVAVEDVQSNQNRDPITSPRCATVSKHYVPIHATVAVENVQSNQNRDPITSPRCATVSRHYVPKHATVAVEDVQSNENRGRHEKMESFKLKLKNVLHSSKFCGICLENDESMSTIDEDLEIIINERTFTKPLQGLIDVMFKEAINLASSNVCNSCLEKLIQSYIFIENAKETLRILDNYVNDLFSKSDDIFNHLPESNVEVTNVLIVLENNTHGSREIKDESNIKVEKNNEIIEEENTLPSIRKKFKCVKCQSMLPTHRALKIHKMKCKKPIFRCRICFKLFRNKQNLKTHREIHLKVKCKFCHEIVLKKELLEHFKTNHGDTLIKCLKCEVCYSLETYQSHAKVCQQIEEDKQQCLMCLKTFTKNDFKSHICKHSCPECTDVPCMHYKYLKSYREQILNNADKIKCVDCDYVCKRKEVLLGHINRDHLHHHPYTCDKCGKQFHSKAVLRAHILRFHENCFVCQFCDSEFSNINNYESHVESCEDIKREFACENCPASFDCTDKLTNHVKRRHSTDIFPCGLCNKKFLKDSKRKEHMVKVHSGLEMKNRVKNLECVVCQEPFDNKGDLVQHMKSHGPNITYPCRICNTEYQTLRQFRAHNRKHNGPFATCHVCGKEMREILLKKHLTTHSDSIETCETCGRSFQNITLLKYHQKVHLESVPCPKCKKMINPARLRRHWRGHLMEENPEKGMKKQQPNLKCQLCEYKTWNNTLLECHMNRHHLKIKPYVCHICSKDFIGKHLLKKHIETHDMKSVVCMVCLKSFANSTCLKMHLRLHTGEKPFTCEICGDRFRSSSIMNVHKLKKHSDKSNICPLCSNKFHTIRDLRRHLIKVHWKEKNKRFDPRELKGLDEKHYHLFHDGRRVKVAEEDVDFYMPC